MFPCLSLPSPLTFVIAGDLGEREMGRGKEEIWDLVPAMRLRRAPCQRSSRGSRDVDAEACGRAEAARQEERRTGEC